MNGARRILRTSAASLLLFGCVQTSPPPVFESISPRQSALESAYDRAKWRWIRNPDGRALLMHTVLEKCFVDPQPPLALNDPGFTLKRHDRTIGGTRYEVVTAFEKRQFWEAVYVRPGSKAPILGVYAEGQCQREAEDILTAYEGGLVKK